MVQIRTDLGIYRESARRIRFEPSGANTATSVQKAIESSGAGGGTGIGPGNTQTITANSYSILTTDTTIFINFAGTVTLTLPDAAGWLAGSGGKGGYPLLIQDISGAAGSHTITINPAGANTINGANSLTVITNYGGFDLMVASSNWIISG